MSQQKRILIVEDFVDTQKLLTHVLTKAGYSVEIAENGKEAVELYNQQADLNKTFDLILTDFFMPVMDGLNSTRILREQGVTIPVIMLTANDGVDDHNAAIAAGCSEIMLKPFHKVDLLKIIEKWLSKASVLKN